MALFIIFKTQEVPGVPAKSNLAAPSHRRPDFALSQKEIENPKIREHPVEMVQ